MRDVSTHQFDDDDDDGDNKHEKRKEQQEQRRRRKIVLILLTSCLFLLVWHVEHNERDAFYVREIDDDDDDFFFFDDDEDGKGGGGKGGGWKRYAVSAHEEKEENECTIDRYHIRDLSLEKFDREYRETKPVVVTFDREFEDEKNERSDFFYEMNRKKNVLKTHGEKTIVLSSANTFSYEKKEVKLKDYLDERGKYLKPIQLHQRADKVWYWFGDNDHDAFGDFFPSFKRTSLIGKKYVPENASVAYSYGVGGPLSGVPYHIHGPGWSESIYGRKKWFLSPPMFEPVFNGNETAARAAMRFKANGNKAKFKMKTMNMNGKNENKKMKNKNGFDVDKYGNEKKVLACVVHPNQAVYFPDRWWHATLNLDESVFISSFVNY
jgi:hypothetical protein